MINTNYRAQSPAFGQKLNISTAGCCLGQSARKELKGIAAQLEPKNGTLVAHIQMFKPTPMEKELFGTPLPYQYYTITLHNKGSKEREVIEENLSFHHSEYSTTKPSFVLAKNLRAKVAAQKAAAAKAMYQL